MKSVFDIGEKPKETCQSPDIHGHRLHLREAMCCALDASGIYLGGLLDAPWKLQGNTLGYRGIFCGVWSFGAPVNLGLWPWV